MTDSEIPRRTFVQTLLLGSAASFVAGAAWRAIPVAAVTPSAAGEPGVLRLRLEDFPMLAEPFGSVRVGFGALNPTNPVNAVMPVIVTRDGDALFAVSSRCTHEGCAISAFQSNRIAGCACHTSLFAPDGSVLNGPASEPLKAYDVTEDDQGTVTIVIPELPAFEVIVREVLMSGVRRVAIEFPALRNLEYEILGRRSVSDPWEVRPFATSETETPSREIFRNPRSQTATATVYLELDSSISILTVATRTRRV